MSQECHALVQGSSLCIRMVHFGMLGRLSDGILMPCGPVEVRHAVVKKLVVHRKNKTLKQNIKTKH